MTKVVDEYKNMIMEGTNLIPLELNLHKYDLVIISQDHKYDRNRQFLALQDI